MSFTVVAEQLKTRRLAAVHAVMPVREVPARFGHYLNQVYAAKKESGLQLDGQNVFVYRNRDDGNVDVDFGVGAETAFEKVGNVACIDMPSGMAATTTHWGDYSKLGEAHSAVLAWCRANGRELTGVSMEVYGHWNDNPALVRTDIYYLLANG